MISAAAAAIASSTPPGLGFDEAAGVAIKVRTAFDNWGVTA